MIALSYSRLSTFNQCPLKFKSQYIDKSYPNEVDNPAFKRGSTIHKQCENYILYKTGKIKEKQPLRQEVKNVTPIIDNIISTYNIVWSEQQMAMDKDFKKCSWYSKDTVYRAILDMVALNNTEASIIDFKTGKVRDYDDSATGQLRLAAFFILSLYPKIEEITTAYLFLDHKHTISRKFYRDNYSSMKDTFTNLLIKVNQEKDWLPTTNKYCHWCLCEECNYKRG